MEVKGEGPVITFLALVLRSQVRLDKSSPIPRSPLHPKVPDRFETFFSVLAKIHVSHFFLCKQDIQFPNQG